MIIGSELKSFGSLLARRKVWQRYLFAVLAVIIALLVRYIPEQYWPGSYTSFILFYPAVLVATWYGGVGPGVLALVLSTLLADFLFIPPVHSFGMKGQELFQFFVFLFGSLLAIGLIENLRRALLFNRDITKKLSLSENRISRFLDSIQGCYFSLDWERRFIYVNENCDDYLSGPRENYYGTSLWKVFPSWQDTEFSERLEEIYREKQPLHFEFYEAPNNRWNDVHLTVGTEGISAHIYNITSRKLAEAGFSAELKYRTDAEAALRKSEGRLRRFIESDVIALAFGESNIPRITAANNSFLKLTDYSREDLENGFLAWPNLTPFKYLEQDWMKWQECLETGATEPWEKECIRKDGTRVSVLIGLTLLEKETQTWAAFVIDLSEQKLHERRQATEQAITRILSVDPLVSSAIPKILETICTETGWQVGAFWELDSARRRLICSEIWTQDQSAYRNFIHDSLQESLDRGQGLIGRVSSSNQSVWLEDLSRVENFTRRQAAIRANLHTGFACPIRIGEEFIGVIEFFSDEFKPLDHDFMRMLETVASELGQFLDRKRTEEDLNVLQIRLNMALHAARIGYWSWDLQSKRLAWADNLEFIHGRSADEFEATFRNILESIHPEDRDRVKSLFEGVVVDSPDYNLEFRTVWPDGSIHWIQVQGQIYYDAQGDPERLIGMGIDITDRKRAEEALKTTNELLERLVHERTIELANANMELHTEMREREKTEREAVEAVQKEQQRLSAQLHDGLCQNLTGVMMMGQALLQKLERGGFRENVDLRRLLELISHSVEEARDMARGLFPVELEANSLMMSLRSLAYRTEQLFKVSCAFHCPEPILIGDNLVATHLYRLAQEGIHNAIRHGDAHKIDLRLLRDADGLSLQVQDDGQGLNCDLTASPGIGIQLMKYRARIIEAQLVFESLSTGTLLTCRLPMPTPGAMPGKAG